MDAEPKQYSYGNPPWTEQDLLDEKYCDEFNRKIEELWPKGEVDTVFLQPASYHSPTQYKDISDWYAFCDLVIELVKQGVDPWDADRKANEMFVPKHGYVDKAEWESRHCQIVC